MTRYKVIGCMSGTSLDGLDLACCTFNLKNGQWSYTIDAATTIAYDSIMLSKLKKANASSAEDFVELDHAVGKFIGQQILRFASDHSFRADFISTHGHTVFHQPQAGFTTQIGNINDIHAYSEVPVIGDFRSLDVALGGNGAPLVPVGDKLLFGDYDYCLNLGGIANVSFEKGGKRLAFDICPVNMALNFLAEKAGQSFDDGGKLAREGKVIPQLLEKLNAIEFNKKEGPKSLGKEYFDQYYLPLLDGYDLLDLLATFVEHIVIQVASSLDSPGKLLVSGGGSFNSYLIEKLEKQLMKKEILLKKPDNILVNFKEALVFAFLGVLHQCKIPNCLSSVTGASKDNIGGTSVGL